MNKVVESGTEAAWVPGPWGEMREVPQSVQALALKKMGAVHKDSPWLDRMDDAARAIVRADVTHTKRLKMLRALADRINSAVSKEAACKRGCDACCKIQVAMSGWEAKIIADELGVELKEPAASSEGGSQQGALDLLGKPCGFLKNGDCSIYESRPIACRLHHSLNLDAQMCQPDVKADDSMVPTLNMTAIHIAYAMCSGRSAVLGDISEFFEEAKRGPSVIERCLDNEAITEKGAEG